MPPAATAAKPTKVLFDPFNSSATGHQRADNRLSGSTSWRQSRTLKLQNQFGNDAGGDKRVSDTVGAGSLDFGQDGRLENGAWEKGSKGLRLGGQKSIWESMHGVKVVKHIERPAKRAKIDKAKPSTVVSPWTPFRREDGSIRETSWTSHELSPSHLLSPVDCAGSETPEAPVVSEEAGPLKMQELPQIFRNLCFYINGSTAPLISDHKLKRLLRQHGASLSIALGGRTVSHVVISRPSSNGGSGGGLAGCKIQKEIASTRGRPVRYVTAEWILECVTAGKRLPKASSDSLKMAPRGVKSVASMFAGSESASTRGAPFDEPG